MYFNSIVWLLVMKWCKFSCVMHYFLSAYLFKNVHYDPFQYLFSGVTIVFQFSIVSIPS